MKVNLKKIGAIVAGATILASSVAFAGLMFGNTELVNENGAPVAKVVVGAKAAASDGVAAANIATALAASAFKTSTLTAQVVGLDGVSCSVAGGAAGSAGSCAVSNEKVKLEVTVPGSVDTSSYTMDQLIGETGDRTLLDRGAAELDNYSLSTAETSSEANPFTDGESGTLDRGASNIHGIYRIDGALYSAFKDETILDKDSGKTFKEKQYLWVKTETQYKDSDDTVDAKIKEMVYQLKFAHDDFGIPVCAKSANSSWAWCSDSDTDNTGTHKVKIKFLNDEWVITKLTAPTTSAASNLGNETRLISGGEVELSKEAVGGIINVGDSLDAGDGFKVVLDDIKSGTTASEQSAIISLVDANGAVVKQTTISPGTTQTLTTTTGGKQILVRVFKTAPGYTFGAKWADMSVLSNQIKLKDGDTTIEVNGERELNKDWTVRLGWKNKDVDNTNSQGNDTDHLRTVLLYRDASTSFLTPGNGVKVLESPVGYNFVYKGLNLDKSSSDDYDNLKFTVEDGSFDYKPDGSDTTRTVNSTSYVRITSSVENAFTTTAGSGKEMIVLFDAAANYLGVGSQGANFSITASNGSIVSGFSGHNWLYPGAALLKISSGKYVLVGNNVTGMAGTGDANGSNILNVSYLPAGAGATTNAGGALFMGYAVLANNSGAMFAGSMRIGSGAANFTPSSSSGIANVNNTFVLGLSEDAGEGISAQKPDAFAVAYQVSTKSLNKDFTGVTTYAKDKVTWANAQNVSGAGTTAVPDDIYGNQGPTTKEINFITERGSIIVDKSDSVFEAKVARKPAHTQFVLSPSTAATTTPGAQVFTGTEGDVFDAGKGVKVKVVDISETVGACTVGAGPAPACTSDTSGVSAVIMPDNKASVTAGVPYGYLNVGSLVVLDRDAVGTDVLVTVGGPAVNEVTKELLAGSVDFNVEKKVVKEVVAGKKIVVAGLTADDTLAAAREFIAALKSQ